MVSNFSKKYKSAKLYRNLCEAVVHVLEEIFIENRYADKAIEKLLKQNPKWGARDRRFIAETTSMTSFVGIGCLVELANSTENDFLEITCGLVHLE